MLVSRRAKVGSSTKRGAVSPRTTRRPSHASSVYGMSRARVRAPRLFARQRGRDDHARDPQQVDHFVGRDLARREILGERREIGQRVGGQLQTLARRARRRSRPTSCAAPRRAARRARSPVPCAARSDPSRRSTSGGSSASTPAIAPVDSGPTLPATIAHTTRRPNTRPSSSEFDARRFAPCTPLHAVSPHAQRCGRVDAPSRSVTTPPDR